MVALVRYRVAILIAVVLAASACDHFYGPHFLNMTGSSVGITVTYQDGKVGGLIVRNCRGFFLGGVNDPTITAVRLVVRKDGAVLYELDSQQLANLRRRQEKEWGRGMLIIDNDEIRFATDRDRTLAESCFHGRPGSGPL